MRMHLIPSKADASQETPSATPDGVADPSPGFAKKRRFFKMSAETITVIIILSVLSFINIPAISVAHKSNIESSCNNSCIWKVNTYAFLPYAKEHDGLYPPLSPVKGDFSFVDEDIYPKYTLDLRYMICPGDPDPPDLKDTKACLSDASYFYLGYAITNETEARAFLDAYEKSFASGVVSFEGDLPVAPGTGTGGGDVIRRLRVGDKEAPVMFDRAENHSRHGVMRFMNQCLDALVSREWDERAMKNRINVVYANGWVESLRMGEKFPAQQWFMDALEALEK